MSVSFMTMPNNLTRISRFGFVNAYLVAEDDGLTLVDTLVPRSAKPILRGRRRSSARRSCASP